MDRGLLVIFALTFIIHLIGTLAYSVRISGTRTRRIGLRPWEREFRTFSASAEQLDRFTAESNEDLRFLLWLLSNLVDEDAPGGRHGR